MALNGKKIPRKGGKGDMPEQAPIVAGAYPARLVQVIDLGLQNMGEWNGETKSPANKVMFTFELVTEFCKDKDGKDMEDKPRWVSESKPWYGLSADRATTSKWYLAMDPTVECEEDLARLVGAPCTVTIVNNPGKGKNAGKVYNNVGGVSPAMKGFPVPELINEPKVFALDEPDMDLFGALPDWIQKIIKDNLEFEGSILQSKLGLSSPKESALDKMDDMPDDKEEEPSDSPY